MFFVKGQPPTPEALEALETTFERHLSAEDTLRGTVSRRELFRRTAADLDISDRTVSNYFREDAPSLRSEDLAGIPPYLRDVASVAHALRLLAPSDVLLRLAARWKEMCGADAGPEPDDCGLLATEQSEPPEPPEPDETPELELGVSEPVEVTDDEAPAPGELWEPVAVSFATAPNGGPLPPRDSTRAACLAAMRYGTREKARDLETREQQYLDPEEDTHRSGPWRNLGTDVQRALRIAREWYAANPNDPTRDAVLKLLATETGEPRKGKTRIDDDNEM
jgi:hypothetical protein